MRQAPLPFASLEMRKLRYGASMSFPPDNRSNQAESQDENLEGTRAKTSNTSLQCLCSYPKENDNEFLPSIRSGVYVSKKIDHWIFLKSFESVQLKTINQLSNKNIRLSCFFFSSIDKPLQTVCYFFHPQSRLLTAVFFIGNHWVRDGRQ